MKHLSRYLTLLFLLTVSLPVFADSLSLTTYYPAPFGSYNLLKLSPATDASMGTCNSSKTGQFYFSSDSNQIKVCDGTAWQLQGHWSANTTLKYVYLTSSVSDTAYKLGMGTSTPQARFHVRGSDDITNGQLRVESTGSDAQLSLFNSSGATSTGFGSISMSNLANSEGLNFKINGNTSMVIDENSNMGIGITDPLTKLHIRGPDAANGQLFIKSSGFESKLHFESDTSIGNILMSSTLNREGLRFQINNTDEMIIDENGNVGIGLTAPTANFDVARSGPATGSLSIAKFDNIHLLDENEATYTSNALCYGTNCTATNDDFMGLRMLLDTASNSASVTLGTPSGLAASSLNFNVGSTSIITATSQAVTTPASVNVGIGVNAPIHKLHVSGPIGGNLDSTNPAASGELQVNCTTVPGKCYAVYAP